MQRIERILCLIVVLEFNETVALGHARVKINRYYDVDDVAESAELVQQIFPSNFILLKKLKINQQI
jgi:hypothetical protein